MGLCGNCTAWQDDTEQVYHADPDIAGIGVISAYIGSAFITLCLSFADFVLTISDSPGTNSFDRLIYKAVKATKSFKIADSKRDFWVPIIQKLVLSLNDQQLLTGLAVLIAGFWTHCSISVYHFALVNDLAWFSANVHFATLVVLQDYFLANPVLRNWRVALMIVLALLLGASTVMMGHYQWYDSWPYDAQCLFDDLIGNIGGEPRYWLRVNLTLLCVNYPLNIIPLFEWPRQFVGQWLEKKPMAARHRAIERLTGFTSHRTPPNSFTGSMRRFTCTLLITTVRGISWTYFALLALIDSRTCSIVLDNFWFGYGLWGIIEDRRIPSSEIDGNENAMTFGQIIPILVLSSLVLIFREAYEDQIKEWEEKQHHFMPPKSSQRSPVRTQSSTTVAASIAPQGFKMTDAIRDIEGEDDLECEAYVLRRLDTEMGERSQAGTSQTSGLEVGQLPRRSTYPVPADDAQLRNESTDCAADVASGSHGAVVVRDDLRYQAERPI